MIRILSPLYCLDESQRGSDQIRRRWLGGGVVAKISDSGNVSVAELDRFQLTTEVGWLGDMSIFAYSL